MGGASSAVSTGVYPFISGSQDLQGIFPGDTFHQSNNSPRKNVLTTSSSGKEGNSSVKSITTLGAEEQHNCDQEETHDEYGRNTGPSSPISKINTLPPPFQCLFAKYNMVAQCPTGAMSLFVRYIRSLAWLQDMSTDCQGSGTLRSSSVSIRPSPGKFSRSSTLSTSSMSTKDIVRPQSMAMILAPYFQHEVIPNKSSSPLMKSYLDTLQNQSSKIAFDGSTNLAKIFSSEVLITMLISIALKGFVQCEIFRGLQAAKWEIDLDNIEFPKYDFDNDNSSSKSTLNGVNKDVQDILLNILAKTNDVSLLNTLKTAHWIHVLHEALHHELHYAFTLASTNPQGGQWVYEYVNKSYEKLTGYTVKEMKLHKADILVKQFHEDNSEDVIDTIRESVFNCSSLKLALLHKKKSGNDFINFFTMHPVYKSNMVNHNSNKTYNVVVHFDVSNMSISKMLQDLKVIDEMAFTLSLLF